MKRILVILLVTLLSGINMYADEYEVPNASGGTTNFISGKYEKDDNSSIKFVYLFYFCRYL